MTTLTAGDEEGLAGVAPALGDGHQAPLARLAGRHRHAPSIGRPDATSETDGAQPGACMDLYEYQGKQFFATLRHPGVSPGEAVTTVDDAVAAAERIGYPVVVKAQVQVGGRGKAGGIKLANDADEVRTHAGNILGMDIKGHTVEIVWIELASDIAEEYYASFTLDRSAKKHLGMLSAQGGVEIEAVAETDPDAIAKIWIDPVDGLTEDAARAWVAAAKLNPAATEGAVDILRKLYTAYTEGDADLIEINPLILKPDRRGPRPRRQGHPRRQLDVPPPRLRGRTRPPRCATSASRPPTRRACSTSASTASSASSPTAPGWPCPPSTSSTRSAASRPTSSTSAAAPTPT